MSHTTSIRSVPITSVSALRACVAELKESGVKCDLLENAAPRMYYENQLQKHMGRKDEICDYVLRLHDAVYDVGFIKQEDGSYAPVFDNYTVGNRFVGVKHVLGAKFTGQEEHWSGHHEESDETLHAIGKLLQGYSKHATIETCIAQGYQITEITQDNEGNCHIHVHIN